jgi:hypothetical protein
MMLLEDLARERQQALLANAVSERQARRAQALSRVARRAERAERELVRSLNEALRLSGELAAEPGEPAVEQRELVRH